MPLQSKPCPTVLLSQTNRQKLWEKSSTMIYSSTLYRYRPILISPIIHQAKPSIQSPYLRAIESTSEQEPVPKTPLLMSTERQFSHPSKFPANISNCRLLLTDRSWCNPSSLLILTAILSFALTGVPLHSTHTS